MRKAFTLIEVLVTISIIAVLIALLIPFLNSARLSSQSTVCQNQLRGLTLAWQAYCKNNEDTSLTYGSFASGATDIAWAEMLAVYMPNESSVRLCPSTVEQRPSPYSGWGSANLAYIADTPSRLCAGSYTFNLAFDSDGTARWGIPASSLFVHAGTMPMGGATVPVFADGAWRESTPDNTVNPPPDLYHGGQGLPNSGIDVECIDRHSKSVNVGFGDCHVESVKLARLWMLQWAKDTTPRNVNSSFAPGYQ